MKKRTLFAFAGIVTAAMTAPALAADVGVSISIGQPGFYGTLDLGGAPPPQLIYGQPVVVRPTRVAVAPVYLRVPPGQYKHWSRYCGQYGACNRPVYFVQDNWYRNVYAPRYREVHYQRGDDWHDRDRHDNRGGDRDDDRGHGRDRGDHGDHRDH